MNKLATLWIQIKLAAKRFTNYLNEAFRKVFPGKDNTTSQNTAHVETAPAANDAVVATEEVTSVSEVTAEATQHQLEQRITTLMVSILEQARFRNFRIEEAQLAAKEGDVNTLVRIEKEMKAGKYKAPNRGAKKVNRKAA